MRNGSRVERGGYSNEYESNERKEMLSGQITPERVKRTSRSIGNYMEENKPNSVLKKVKEFALSPAGLGVGVGILFAATVVLGVQDPSPLVTQHPFLSALMVAAGSIFAGAATTKIATDAYAKEDSAKHRAKREERNERRW